MKIIKLSLKQFESGILSIVIAIIALLFTSQTSAVVGTSSVGTIITVNINAMIAITSSSTVTLNLTPFGSGSQSWASDTVNIITNDVTGYSATISMNSSNSLSNGNAYPIVATSGVAPTGASLTVSSSNPFSTWGFCVQTATNTNSTCPNVGAGATNQALSSTFKFSAVPTATPYVFASLGTNTTGANITDTIFYSVASSTSQPSGNGTSGTSYTGTVIYTGVAL